MFIIKNEYLTVVVKEIGATLWSIQDNKGHEYLWQGDVKYWSDRAPNIFPYVARLTEGKYILDSKTYEMDIHGFAKDTLFEAVQKSDSHIVFRIKNTEETYRQYPYKFEFAISYELVESKILVTYSVKNEDDKEMYFGLGGHPGFNVPLDKDTEFEDWYLEFDAVRDAKRVGFSADCFVTEGLDDFALESGVRLPLHHGLFDDDAIVLTDMARCVTLKSNKSKRAVRVTYPDMPYLGLWHWPKTDAPYICIEPWLSLPSRKGVIEDLATQPGLIHLKQKCEYENQITVEVIAKEKQESE